ncbi:hypothetical protein V2J09_004357 [Rumex salicifolius]
MRRKEELADANTDVVVDNDESSAQEEGRYETDLQRLGLPLNALGRNCNQRAMKIRANIGGRKVVVLVDSRASHNFVNQLIVEVEDLSVKPTGTFGVRKIDLVLGYAWFLSMKKIIVDWEAMTMEFNQDCRMVVKVQRDPTLAFVAVSINSLQKLSEVEYGAWVWEIESEGSTSTLNSFSGPVLLGAFGQPSVEYLSQILSDKGAAMDPSKVAIILT